MLDGFCPEPGEKAEPIAGGPPDALWGGLQAATEPRGDGRRHKAARQEMIQHPARTKASPRARAVALMDVAWPSPRQCRRWTVMECRQRPTQPRTPNGLPMQQLGEVRQRSTGRRRRPWATPQRQFHPRHDARARANAHSPHPRDFSLTTKTTAIDQWRPNGPLQTTRPHAYPRRQQGRTPNPTGGGASGSGGRRQRWWRWRRWWRWWRRPRQRTTWLLAALAVHSIGNHSS